MKILKILKEEKKNINKAQIIEKPPWKMNQAGKYCRLKAL